MQVDNTQVTIDKSEDPFKDFGPTIVGNIVSYSSSLEEEEEVKDTSQKGDEVVSTEKIVEEAKVTTPTSTPITPITITPSTPLASTMQVQSDDETKTQNLISSLSKILERKKSVQSIEKTLTNFNE